VLGVTGVVVYMERAQRRIAVNYAKRQQGRRMYAGQTSHLPFKINMSGVIPPIFASSLILFPATIASWFGTSQAVSWLQRISASLSPGQPVLHHSVRVADHVLLLLLHGARVQFARDRGEFAEVRARSSPGIRPGQQTAEYIDKVLTRLTFWGALYITAVCLIPEFLILEFSVPFYFRWNVAPDHRRRDDGLHGADAGPHDESPIRRVAQEGEPPRLWQGGEVGRPPERSNESKNVSSQDL
jgi:preprotein translocase subunit SecY